MHAVESIRSDFKANISWNLGLIRLAYMVGDQLIKDDRTDKAVVGKKSQFVVFSGCGYVF